MGWADPRELSDEELAENDLATLLDRRLRRLEEMKNGKLIEQANNRLRKGGCSTAASIA